MENIQNNYYQETEISLKEVIFLLSKSKKLVIFLTLFFFIISSFYASTLKSKFVSTVSIEMGNFENDNYMPNLEIFSNTFSNISTSKITNNTIIMSVSGSLSSKTSESMLNNGIDYIFINKEKWYSNQIDKLEGDVNSIKYQISILDSQLERLSKIDKTLPSAYGLETYFSQLFINKSELLFNKKGIEEKKNSLKEKILNPKFTLSQIYEDIITREIKPSRTNFIVIGFLSGLLLSIVIVIIRSIFFRD